MEQRAMTDLSASRERRAASFNGYLLLLVMLASLAAVVLGVAILKGPGGPVIGPVALIAGGTFAFLFISCGF